jgi:hypothetical protein
MCLERLTDCVPRFVARGLEDQVNKTFVLFEGARNCKDVLVNLKLVARKEWTKALQTTISAQPIRENDIVNFTTIKLGRSLIASKSSAKYCGCRVREYTIWLDLEAWS